MSLKRSLSLADLILYGVIVIQPVAPMSVYGVLATHGRGHVVTVILIAMLAMLPTAISYGRMARVYPSAGSAFTYVSQEISPTLGYLTGWAMVMDYIVNPTICIVWVSQQLHVFLPEVAYSVWAVVLAILLTILNLQRVRTSARLNAALALGMGVVIALFLVAAARYIVHAPHDALGLYTRPFYNPATWDSRAVLGGTSIAVLTYIGFDGISTLSEEATNPRRNILLATVLTCCVIGALSAIQVYAAQLVWPDFTNYPNVDTAFTSVAGRAWPPLFGIVGATLILANIGSGLGAQLGAARLLYGMGRSNALPARFFGAVDATYGIPRQNVLLVGALALLGALLLPTVAGDTTAYGLGASLLNFGALIAFMGVNAAAFVRCYRDASRNRLTGLLIPLVGAGVCAVLWWNLSIQARIFGAVWTTIGLVYGAIQTKGFKLDVMRFKIPGDPW